MERGNMRLFGEIPSRKKLSYILLLIIVIIPFLFSLLRTDSAQSIDSKQMVEFLQCCFHENEFWISANEDFTILCIALNEDGGRILIQSLFCFVAEIVLLRILRKSRKRHFQPFAFVYSIYTVLILTGTYGDYMICWDHGDKYNRIMLWGRYVRAMYGWLPWIVFAALIISLLHFIAKDYKC